MTHFPPQNPMTQDTLRSVIRRLDTIDEREQKHRHLPTQQFAARPCRLGAAAHRPPRQRGTEAYTKRLLGVQPTGKAHLRGASGLISPLCGVIYLSRSFRHACCKSLLRAFTE